MAHPVPEMPQSRVDLLVIAEHIQRGWRVLDVGCGDGTLLKMLCDQYGVDARGIDVARENVNAAVTQGLSVIQGDADADLDTYPDKAFDAVILSQTIQATRNPRQVLEHLLRIGQRAFISLPNFGYWRIRAQILFWGRMPVTRTIGHQWYDTPNIHLCTLRDFAELANEVGARIDHLIPLDRLGRPFRESLPISIANLVAPQALFVLSMKNDPAEKRSS